MVSFMRQTGSRPNTGAILLRSLQLGTAFPSWMYQWLCCLSGTKSGPTKDTAAIWVSSLILIITRSLFNCSVLMQLISNSDCIWKKEKEEKKLSTSFFMDSEHIGNLCNLCLIRSLHIGICHCISGRVSSSKGLLWVCLPCRWEILSAVWF